MQRVAQARFVGADPQQARGGDSGLEREAHAPAAVPGRVGAQHRIQRLHGRAGGEGRAVTIRSPLPFAKAKGCCDPARQGLKIQGLAGDDRAGGVRFRRALLAFRPPDSGLARAGSGAESMSAA